MNGVKMRVDDSSSFESPKPRPSSFAALFARHELAIKKEQVLSYTKSAKSDKPHLTYHDNISER